MAPDQFGLKFNNIPLINLRKEFDYFYKFLHSPDAEQYLNGTIGPIRTQLFIWGGMPNDFMSLILQRAILGVESYLPAALLHTSVSIGNQSEELAKRINNPFSFGSKSAVYNIYHLMPSAIHSELSLQRIDQSLYKANRIFYREVRNPLFHGQQLSNPEIKAVRGAFLHIAHLYRWIDCWYTPENLIKGGSVFSDIHQLYKSTVAPIHSQDL